MPQSLQASTGTNGQKTTLFGDDAKNGGKRALTFSVVTQGRSELVERPAIRRL